MRSISGITFKTGSIFDSDAQAIVNPVNTVGVMGAGLAKDFKMKYPHMYAEYLSLCYGNRMKPGCVKYIEDTDKIIVPFPTKRHWRDPSELRFIEEGLKHFCSTYASHGIQSVAFPRLGCGLGGLDWWDVRFIMGKALREIPIDVQIYV